MEKSVIRVIAELLSGAISVLARTGRQWMHEIPVEERN